ncbi:phosphate ABC transporter ATP-binding protein [Candidatus Acetothermia bacterium]|jgi:tungstate transport system ATP-binding protein|nr:phosphate ABC transporter ATP-binding protein [Candidatus Acetothermia bacterium]MCI2426733.1 phosphate ABC transporter ATP-binding protein [Candidatus Acetothermia bacterium]MCI2427462.1 phosphate ABC transporter ATP-binding protein [Candidatus Acetothermia bacterium]MCI2428857.1 phosphate ABC transporter ATP-binding protein [Candidatus Acetothermia bacterium]
MITVEDLYFGYQADRPILAGINFSVARGDLFALMGPSGSGKTTILRLFNLFITPWHGRILLDKVDLQRLTGKERLGMQRRMAMVFEAPALFNTSVAANIAYGLKVRHEKRATINNAVQEMLALIGLQKIARKSSSLLSRGEAQRVAIARAMIVRPEILFLDEPTANLDPHNVSRIEELIRTVNEQFGTTIVMTTHNMGQARRLATTVGFLYDGQLVEWGDTKTIFTAAVDERTTAFISGDLVC